MPVSDDLTIPDEAIIWRRVPLIPNLYVETPPGSGTLRPSSAVFRDETEEPQTKEKLHEVSCHLAELTSRERVLQDYPNCNITAITAGLARQHDMMIVRRPEPDDPSHIVMIPKSTVNKRIDKCSRKIAHEASWEFTLPGLLEWVREHR